MGLLLFCDPCLCYLMLPIFTLVAPFLYSFLILYYSSKVEDIKYITVIANEDEYITENFKRMRCTISHSSKHIVIRVAVGRQDRIVQSLEEKIEYCKDIAHSTCPSCGAVIARGISDQSHCLAMT